MVTNCSLENTGYKANWIKTTTTYTVAYWWENPDPQIDQNGNKTYGYSIHTVEIKTDKKAGEYITTANITTFENNAPFETFSSKNGNFSEKIYFRYNDSKTIADFESNDGYSQNGVPVKGDGSTVINIYYDRIEYELRFYYAMKTTGASPKYYIIGGSTYHFGSDTGGDATNRSDEVSLIDVYMDTSSNKKSSQRGEVSSMMRINMKKAMKLQR